MQIFSSGCLLVHPIARSEVNKNKLLSLHFIGGPISSGILFTQELLMFWQVRCIKFCKLFLILSLSWCVKASWDMDAREEKEGEQVGLSKCFQLFTFQLDIFWSNYSSNGRKGEMDVFIIHNFDWVRKLYQRGPFFKCSGLFWPSARVFRRNGACFSKEIFFWIEL